MHIIFNDFLATPICKKPLNAYLIRELIYWSSKAPQFKITHSYLFKRPSESYTPSYDMKLVHCQIIRNQQQSIKQQTIQLSLTNTDDATTLDSSTQIASDDDGDSRMQSQSQTCTASQDLIISTSPSLNIYFFPFFIISLSFFFLIYIYFLFIY